MPTTPHSSRGPCGSYMGSAVPRRVRQAESAGAGPGSSGSVRAGHEPIIASRAAADGGPQRARPKVPVEYCSNPHQRAFRRRYASVPCGNAGPSSHGRSGPVTPCFATMLFFVRLLGFLAPFAIAGLAVIAVAVTAQTEPADREALALVVAAGVVAGMTTMALVAWSYIGWRLSRIARALERTLDTRRIDPDPRGRHPRRATPGARVQRRQRRLPAGRGARHP